RACAIGVIEGKQSRLRIFVADVAGLALKRFAESVPLSTRNLEQNLSATFTKTDFNRIDESLPHVRSGLEAIDENDCGRLEIHIEQRFRLRVLEDSSVLVNSRESASFQVRQVSPGFGLRHILPQCKHHIEPCVCWPLQNRVRDLIDGIASYRSPTDVAVCDAHTGE